MVSVCLGLTTRVRIIRKHTTDSTYGSKHNIVNYRPPRGLNANCKQRYIIRYNNSLLL